jgi:hypothetical protein
MSIEQKPSAITVEDLPVTEAQAANAGDQIDSAVERVANEVPNKDQAESPEGLSIDQRIQMVVKGYTDKGNPTELVRGYREAHGLPEKMPAEDILAHHSRYVREQVLSNPNIADLTDEERVSATEENPEKA